MPDSGYLKRFKRVPFVTSPLNPSGNAIPMENSSLGTMTNSKSPTISHSRLTEPAIDIFTQKGEIYFSNLSAIFLARSRDIFKFLLIYFNCLNFSFKISEKISFPINSFSRSPSSIRTIYPIVLRTFFLSKLSKVDTSVLP